MDSGPLEVLDPSRWDLTLPAAAPPADLAGLEAELTALDAVLEQELAELTGLLETPWRAELEQLHAEAEEGVYQDRDCGDEGELDQAALAAEETDSLITAAYQSAPMEIWQGQPQPWPEPTITGGWYTLPGLPPPAPAPPLPPTIPPAALNPTVSLVNLTRPGQADFYVGDEWDVAVSGMPNNPVEITVWQNGIQSGPTILGYTAADGRWTLRGYMSAAEIGDWLEEWHVGGVLAQPILSFTVLA